MGGHCPLGGSTVTPVKRPVQQQGNGFEQQLGLTANILTVSTFVLSLGLGGVTWFGTLTPGWRVATGLGAALLFGVSIGGVSAWLIARRRNPPKGYRIVSVEQTYEFSEENPRIQRQIARIQIRATRPGTFLFIDRTHWSGSKQPLLSAPLPDQELWEVPGSYEGWHPYVIALRQPLARRESTDVVLQADYHAVSSDDFQWVGRTPTEPIEKKLLLRIVLGSHCPPMDSFWAGIMSPGTGDREIAGRLPIHYDDRPGQAWVEVEKPKVGKRYQMRVRFSFPTSPESLPAKVERSLEWRNRLP